MKLPNLPFKEYITLDMDSLAVYRAALRLGKFPGVDHFEAGDIFETPWGFVKDMQELISVSGLTYKDFIEAYLDYEFIKPERAYNLGIFSLQECIAWTVKQIEQINLVERAKLSQGHLSSAELQAGIEDLKIFRTFPQTDSLAGGDPLKYEEVRRKLKYRDAFLKLSYDTAIRSYHKKLREILNPPPKKHKR